MNKIKCGSALLAATLLAVPATIALTGCSSVNDVIGSGDVGTLVGSKHSTDSDRDKYSVLQNIDGQEFTTVISVTQNNGNNKFDVNEFQELLTQKNINWYQIIASNSMGTQTQETCYLYMPANTSFTDMTNTATVISANGEWNAMVLTADSYKQYADNVNQFDFSHNETTYYGPAASDSSAGSTQNAN